MRTQQLPAVTAWKVAPAARGRRIPHGACARIRAIKAPRTRSMSRTSSSGQRSFMRQSMIEKSAKIQRVMRLDKKMTQTVIHRINHAA
jgi:hypothetical protein